MTTSVPDLFFDFEHFTLGQLDRVVSIGVTQPLGDMQLSLLSLECYRAGFVAIIAVEQERLIPDPPPPSEEYVSPLLFRSSLGITDIFDDIGGHYLARQRAGTGGGVGPDRIGLWLVYCFAPALDPAAHTLSFCLTQVGELRYSTDGQPLWADAEVLRGSWTVSFALPAAMEEAS